MIELSSDIGGGKTVFVKGLASGMGTSDHVASPTFTINRQYRALGRDVVMHHYDFYRLDDPGIMAAEISDTLSENGNIVVVEWSTIVEHLLPDDRLQIAIRADGESSRMLELLAADGHEHLLKGIE